MKITLFKAVEELRHILDQMDPETGELPEEFENARGLVAHRAVAVAAYVLQSDREADMVETYARELMARVKTQRARHEWLRGYLLYNMQTAGIEKIDGEQFKILRQVERDESVDVFDERQVPAEFLEDPRPPVVSKAKIKAAIKAGVDVPGARIVAKDRLTIK